jgi:DNA-binding transcriptional regulator YdaS (Cro superfamily)
MVKTPPPDTDRGLRLAIEAAGSLNALATVLGIASQSLSEWKRIPAHRVLQVEKVTGIAREILRPDLCRDQ